MDQGTRGENIVTGKQQPSLFENDRLTLDNALDLSIASLRAYGEKRYHWAVAYSGGKDSTAMLAFVVWALKKTPYTRAAVPDHPLCRHPHGDSAVAAIGAGDA
jgi:predicted PP-loop superfamily ATPase